MQTFGTKTTYTAVKRDGPAGDTRANCWNLLCVLPASAWSNNMGCPRRCQVQTASAASNGTTVKRPSPGQSTVSIAFFLLCGWAGRPVRDCSENRQPLCLRPQRSTRDSVAHFHRLLVAQQGREGLMADWIGRGRAGGGEGAGGFRPQHPLPRSHRAHRFIL